MPHINLLPWREELRRERQRRFINIAAGAAVLMLGIIALAHIQINGMIEGQQARNTFIQDHITRVDAEIKEIETLEKEKQALLARMQIIQELQSSRAEIVHLFDETARIIPEQVYLIKLSRTGREIHLEGVADSNEDISEFMRKLSDSPWFSNPRLTVIETGKTPYVDDSWFKLTVNLTNGKVEKEEK